MKKVFLLSFLFVFAIIPVIYSQDNIDLDLTRSEKSKFQPEVKDQLKKNLNFPQKRNNIGVQNSEATSFHTAIANDGGSSQNGRAPMGGRRYVRTVYLIKPSEMAAVGSGGDVLTHIVWEYLTNNLNFGQNIPTRCDSLKIWFQNTTDATNLKSTTWATAVTGMTLVYHGDYILPSGEYGQNIFVNLGGPGTSPFTTIAGNGMYVAFEYTSNVPVRIAALTSSANVSCNFQGLAGGCLTGQSQTGHLATMTASAFRPVTYLGKGSPADVFVDVANVAAIYHLNQAMVCPCPDTNDLTVIVDHLRRGVVDTLNVNTRVLNLNGTLKEEWNDVIITNDSVRNYYIYHTFTKSTDTKKTDSIVVTIAPIAGENVTYNNAAYSLKYSTLNTSSYFDNINLFAFGGVGPGIAGGELAARFRTPCPITLSAVRHGFFTITSNASYQIKIYSGGNGAGNVVYTSPVLSSGVMPNPTVAVEKDTIHYLTSPVTLPAGDYYVSVVQTTATNPGFAYYGESPIRQNKLYFWSGTLWTEFSTVPANAFNVKIMPVTTLQLNIGMWLEGFFNGTSMVPDTVTMIARKLTSPYAILETSKSVVGSSGIGTFKFNSLNNDSCYLYEFRHRNHIRVFSHLVCEKIDECGALFDMRTVPSNVLGSNLVFVPTMAESGYAAYTSDVNQDDLVEAADCAAIDNDASLFVKGYVVTDVNGDGIVDGVDATYCENNALNFVSAITPP